LADALQSMDYEAALASQMEIEQLQREARWLRYPASPVGCVGRVRDGQALQSLTTLRQIANSPIAPATADLALSLRLLLAIVYSGKFCGRLDDKNTYS
jgi:hypothetical protein